MSDTTPRRPVSAEELRTMILEKEMQALDERARLSEIEQKKRAEFADRFLEEHVTEAERAMIRRLVMQAVSDGKLEAMVYAFPSDLCSDGGRAINSADPDWPASLQGKARELYDAFQAVARPQGYKLFAQIINFPGGMPGDVGFFLSWAPDAA